MFENAREWYHALPEKKKYVELITSVLTVPVLLTVIFSNVTNLADKDKQNAPAPTHTIERVLPATTVVRTINEATPTSPLPTVTDGVCKKEIGPVEILAPKEGETVTEEPVTIDISHNDEYCSIVWSYRINNSGWSDYTDKAINLYNLSSGSKTLEVRIKSIASKDETLLKRNFIYKNLSETPTPTPTPTAPPPPTATPSASAQ